MMINYNISVIIPTLNASEYIESLLHSIQIQTVSPLEIIVVDSSSTDTTPCIIRSYGESSVPVHLVSISREDFSHGKTRNYAASLAQGDLFVFLTQDALPVSSDWLENLVAPFSDEALACVFGRHVARPGGNPLIAMDIERHFASFGSENYMVQCVDWSSEESVRAYRANEGWYCFNSNVNSAVRKDVWDKIRFRDVSYSEDQLFGKDVIESGYKKVYARNAPVYHSHEYTLFQYFKRYFDEYRGLKSTLGVVERAGFVKLIPLIIMASLRDMYALAARDIDNKLFWLGYTPLFHAVRRAGAFLGGRYEKIPPRLRKHLSLENRE